MGVASNDASAQEQNSNFGRQFEKKKVQALSYHESVYESWTLYGRQD
jgi:hypothetical protein